MKLPATDNPQKYHGLYVIDFGPQCAIGYTAEEVAALLESERFADAKVYKIHRAYPDGAMELNGVSRNRFFLESGMFFHCRDERSARVDYRRLADWSGQQAPPCRTQLQLAHTGDKQWLIALIYPAEYEHEVGDWMHDSSLRTDGPIDAGISQVSRYYHSDSEILEKRQLWPREAIQQRDREQLIAAVGQTLQR